ncbi:unnamed protein product [Moneuplotes crassus]|uniref:Uncharacterized protein n=1 Tax=Euplotes crassus TaxID=5936 RepID=A0AAD1UD34_EUPCR|nr:unnamed protein product [Moneuplotes crassus]
MERQLFTFTLNKQDLRSIKLQEEDKESPLGQSSNSTDVETDNQPASIVGRRNTGESPDNMSVSHTKCEIDFSSFDYIVSHKSEPMKTLENTFSPYTSELESNSKVYLETQGTSHQRHLSKMVAQNSDVSVNLNSDPSEETHEAGHHQDIEQSQKCSAESIKKCLEILNTVETEDESDIFMDIDLLLAKINSLAMLYRHYTGRTLEVSESNNVSLSLDLSFDGDREFVSIVQNIPELENLKIINFDECDEDVEMILRDKLSSVGSLFLAAEGYCIDANDYLEIVAEISELRHLHLHGFIIDSENLERLLENPGLQSLSFYCCNLGIDEYLQCQPSESPAVGMRCLRFFFDETPSQDMNKFLQVICESELMSTLEELVFVKSKISKNDLIN